MDRLKDHQVPQAIHLLKSVAGNDLQRFHVDFVRRNFSIFIFIYPVLDKCLLVYVYKLLLSVLVLLDVFTYLQKII